MADENPDELREVGEAALVLASLKYATLDSKTATELHYLKKKVLGSIGANPDAESHQNGHNADGFASRQRIPPIRRPDIISPNEPELPQFGLELQGWNPPHIPPVSGLDGLIGRCSKPFEKQLTASDVRDDQSRLTMNKDDVENFLKPLLMEGERLEPGIPITAYDLVGREYSMFFKVWAEKIHVLTGVGWKTFYKNHALKAIKDFITIWMFRHVNTGKLCFVITSRRLDSHVPIKRRKIRQV